MPSNQTIPPVRRYFRRFFWGGGWLLNLLVILHLTEWDSYIPMRLYSSWLPWALPVALLFTVSIWQRMPGLLLLLVLPVWYGISQAAPEVRQHEPLPSFAGGNQLKVMSFNVWSKNDSIEQVGALILKEAPDILLLQEIAPRQYRALTDYFQKTSAGKPFDSIYQPDAQLALLSRFPIARHDFAVGSSRIKVQKAILKIGQAEFLVYNVHFLRKFWKRRIAQIRRFVAEELRPARFPVILGGDFNATANDRACLAVGEELVNAFDRTGDGLGLTFPAAISLGPLRLSWLPMVRIDHIFASPGLAPRQAQIADSAAGSDHRPVVAIFAFPGI